MIIMITMIKFRMINHTTIFRYDMRVVSTQTPDIAFRKMETNNQMTYMYYSIYMVLAGLNSLKSHKNKNTRL